MKALSRELINQLRIPDTIEMEASSQRNLVPKELNWDQIGANKESIARWIGSLLRTGLHPGLEQIVSVRKLHGTRPVPIWGPAERIVYRALTELAVGKAFRLDRSAKAYLDFVNAPVSYGQTILADAEAPSLFTEVFWYFRSEVKYVVKSDITAFYQYVDHAILARELLVCGADLEPVQALIDLLREIQGRSYGIPQLLDASDMLSEIYIDRLERDLLRHGLVVWRYNDDFRIACKSYEDALLAIETLDSSARDVGLVISESKTLIYKFSTYVSEVEQLDVKPPQESADNEEVEVAIGDYTDDFSQDVDAALSLVQRAVEGDESAEGSINIRKLSPADLRLLRRAFGSLAQEADPRALDMVHPFVIYVPALFPSIMRYLQSVCDVNAGQVVDVVDKIVSSASMSEWQNQWLLQLMRDMCLLDGFSLGNRDSRVDWIRKVRRDSSSAVSVAFATRALVQGGNLTIDELIRAYEQSPTSLTAIYVEAIGEFYRLAPADGLRKRVNAVASGSPLHKVLIGDLNEKAPAVDN